MSIKKKFGMALATTALGAMLIGGGTFALFSDTATNEGNTFTAGTVAIDAGQNGTVFTGALYIDNMAPGDRETGKLTITNNGSLKAFAKVSDYAGTGDLFGGDYPVQIILDDSFIVLDPGDSATLDVEYYFPIEAGNEYQGAEGQVDFEVQAVQYRNNVDSAGNPISWNETEIP